MNARLSTAKVIACPHCEQLALKRSVVSFSTGDLTRWSDGYVGGWFNQPDLVRCVACGDVFWIDEAVDVGDLPPESSPQARRSPKWLSWMFGRDESHSSGLVSIPEPWKLARPVEGADVTGIALGVEQLKGGTTAQEQRMRRLLWWTLNDPNRRPGRPVFPAFVAVRDKHEASNLHRLLALSESDGVPTMETVEILREQGRFDEAYAALGRVDPKKEGFDIIRQRIADRDCWVCTLREPEWLQS